MFRKKIIAIIGNDGSGKTYQANRVFEELKNDKISVKLVHSDHLFIRIPKSFRSNKYFSIKGEKSQSIKLFRILKGNNLFGFIFPLISYFDFLVFYLVEVWFSLGEIIVFDRYFYDKLVKFYDLGICNHSVFNLLLKITPAPEFTIYLDLPGDVNFKRKRELTISILNRRRILYKKIVSDFGFIKINAEKEKKKVFSEIINKLKYV